MSKYYVCNKFRTIWSGRVDQMIEGYEYPGNSTWYFDTEEEADAFIETLLDERIS